MLIVGPGINYESSFEAEILGNTQECQIWGYDFSVKSFGPQITEVGFFQSAVSRLLNILQAQASRTHFQPYGLAGKDAHGPDDKDKMYTLESLMKLNGHTHIDILKVRLWTPIRCCTIDVLPD
jgi:hypothetical protein